MAPKTSFTVTPDRRVPTEDRVWAGFSAPLEHRQRAGSGAAEAGNLLTAGRMKLTRVQIGCGEPIPPARRFSRGEADRAVLAPAASAAGMSLTFALSGLTRHRRRRGWIRPDCVEAGTGRIPRSRGLPGQAGTSNRQAHGPAGSSPSNCAKLPRNELAQAGGRCESGRSCHRVPAPPQCQHGPSPAHETSQHQRCPA